MRCYIRDGVGSNWFSGKIKKPFRLLERKFATRTLEEKRKRKVEGKGKAVPKHR